MGARAIAWPSRQFALGHRHPRTRLVLKIFFRAKRLLVIEKTMMEIDGRQPHKVMSTFQNLFSSTKPTVKKLMSLQRNLPEDKDRYVEKAIEHLVKKLRKRDVEELEKAINYPGVPTNCVTIARSMDGRLQVANRKGLPHVIYCRLWRWADLQSPHELRPLKSCRHPFSKRDKEVCVNPYHYERVDLSVAVPRRVVEVVPKMSSDSAPWLPLSVVEVNSRVQESMQCEYEPTITLDCHEYSPSSNCCFNEVCVRKVFFYSSSIKQPLYDRFK